MMLIKVFNRVVENLSENSVLSEKKGVFHRFLQKVFLLKVISKIKMSSFEIFVGERKVFHRFSLSFF